MHYLKLTAVGFVCALSEAVVASKYHCITTFVSQVRVSPSSGHRSIEHDAKPAIQPARINRILKLFVYFADTICIVPCCNHNCPTGSCPIANTLVEQLEATYPTMPTSTPLKDSLLLWMPKVR